MNNQKPSPIEREEDGRLAIFHIFHTIQGEGPLAGRSAIFVRLAGCNLGNATCPFCFYGKTKVRMADFSSKLIAEVRAGDIVTSYDERMQQFVPRRVTSVMQRQVSEIFRLKTHGGRTTYVTGNHEFLVKDKGWISVKDFRVGDTILHLSQAEKMRLHNPMKDPFTVLQMLRTTSERGEDTGPWIRMTKEQQEKAIDRMRNKMLTSNPMKVPGVAVKGFLNRWDRGERTTTEIFVEKICSEFGLIFVGGGELVAGNKIPDFLIEGTNKLVEVWDQSQTEFLGRDEKWINNRRSIFESAGYEVLFLPVKPFSLGDEVGSRKESIALDREEEISRIRQKISEYARNGFEVSSLKWFSSSVSTQGREWPNLAGSRQSFLTVYNLEVEDTHTYLANDMIVHNCDTIYTPPSEVLTPIDLVYRIVDWKPHTRLIVLTGGEPFRQNIRPFVEALLDIDYEVQIETNGTLYLDLPYGSSNLTVVCSPKTGKIHSELMPKLDSLKYIVRKGKMDEKDGLPIGLARPANRQEIFLQPCDEQDSALTAENVEEAVRLCQKFDYRLSLQQQKILGLA